MPAAASRQRRRSSPGHSATVSHRCSTYSSSLRTMRSSTMLRPRWARRVFSTQGSSGHCTQPSQCSRRSPRICTVSRFWARRGFRCSPQPLHWKSAPTPPASRSSGCRSCFQDTALRHFRHSAPGRPLVALFQRSLRSKRALTSALAELTYEECGSPPPRAAAACAKREPSMPRHSAMRAASVPSTGASVRETSGWIWCRLYHSKSTLRLSSCFSSSGWRARSASSALGPSPDTWQITYSTSWPARTAFPRAWRRSATWTCGWFLASG
mmetsp:Transcript_41698/g.90923  ORF Transcript_41698/g.90923 Transcript_41698/m.90923 type:complete len:268 (-) Transcript_41698:3440-4243(-)